MNVTARARVVEVGSGSGTPCLFVVVDFRLVDCIILEETRS